MYLSTHGSEFIIIMSLCSCSSQIEMFSFEQSSYMSATVSTGETALVYVSITVV